MTVIIDATLIKKQANSYGSTPSSGQALTYEELGYDIVARWAARQ